MWPCSPPWNDGRFSTLSRSAVAGLVRTALSHVSLVIGLGSSCSQPLVAKRPSRTDGSFLRRVSVRPGGAVSRRSGGGIGFILPGFAGEAVFGTTPSCSQRRHAASNSALRGVPGAAGRKADFAGG